MVARLGVTDLEGLEFVEDAMYRAVQAIKDLVYVLGSLGDRELNERVTDAIRDLFCAYERLEPVWQELSIRLVEEVGE